MITRDAYQLREIIGDRKIVCGSGYMDPLHVGHVRYVKDTVKLAWESFYNPSVVFIVNGRRACLRKKNFEFMRAIERAEIVQSLRGVNHVLIWSDGSTNVAGALSVLRPAIFTKGGDVTEENFSRYERQVCEDISCRVVFGVGGGKIQSSSFLTGNNKRS